MNAPTTIDNEVLYAVDGHVATITLNRPERMNTISRAMLGQLTDYLLAADADPEVRVVILTGTGRAFCAGLDLTEATGERQGGISNSSQLAVTLDLRSTPPTVLHEMDTPVICALNGSAAGYGMDTALGCDIRLMAESAKLAAAFTKRGVVPEFGRHLALAAPDRLVEGGGADLHRPHADGARDRRPRPRLGSRPGRRADDPRAGDRR